MRQSIEANIPIHSIEDIMNRTVEYYNRNADDYYWLTVGLDMDATRQRFAAYLPAEASIIDLGCGSGRDVMAFGNMGHNAVGLDAAEELVRLAKERLEIRAFTGDMSSWTASEPYNGIWCCASLIHLNDRETRRFFEKLDRNLKPGGVLYISVKSGIQTGEDSDGVYQRNFTEEELRELAGTVPGLEVKEVWYTEDSMKRDGFRWINLIAQRNSDQ